MSTDFIFDFETLGQTDDAVLLSVGVLACPDMNIDISFSELLEHGIYMKLERKEQVLLGRALDTDTVNWWKKQGSEAREVLANTNLVDCFNAYCKIRAFLFDNGYSPKNSKIWSRGMIDQRWWQSFCNTLSIKDKNINDPTSFWMWRDTRTALDILVGNTNGRVGIAEPEEFIKHHALCDCCMDYLRLKDAIINE